MITRIPLNPLDENYGHSDIYLSHRSQVVASIATTQVSICVRRFPAVDDCWSSIDVHEHATMTHFSLYVSVDEPLVVNVIRDGEKRTMDNMDRDTLVDILESVSFVPQDDNEYLCSFTSRWNEIIQSIRTIEIIP